MNKFFKDMLTDHTNDTFDVVKVICLLSFITYIALAIASLATDHPFSGIDFAGGIGTMAVGFGINFKLAAQPK